jgi:ABC-type multidrug transport system permease subunit
MPLCNTLDIVWCRPGRQNVALVVSAMSAWLLGVQINNKHTILYAFMHHALPAFTFLVSGSIQWTSKVETHRIVVVLAVIQFVKVAGF